MTVVPITTAVDRVYPFQVLIPAGEAGLERDSKALCEQIRTLAKSRVQGVIGTLGEERMGQLREALDRHLWL